MTHRERIIQIIDDWADDPDSFEDWNSVLKVNVLIEVMKQFKVDINTADIPSITGLTTLMAYLDKPRKKVLVLDCDGVLWDGIVGEGTAYVTADHLNFQGKCRAFESQGVLLALCSKNNPQDVHDAFLTLEAMSLKPAQICAEEISWDSKVDGLKRLAAKLNLGLDSFVFVDDSAIERAEVRERLPEVAVLDPHETIGNYFPNLPGKSLTEQYRLRQTVQTAMDEMSGDLRQAFLDSLDMRAVMRVNDESLAPRIAELSQKTNQFNFTLARLTEPIVRFQIGGSDYKVFCASLVDRFGDAGWVAQAVFMTASHYIELKDFCVSCRVIGRGFERAFIEKCMSLMPYSRPFSMTYVPGPKNSVCANFFDGQRVADHVPRAPVKWEE